VSPRQTQARLLAVGRAGTAMQVEQIVRGWRRIDRQAERDDAARQHVTRTLDVHQDDDGTVIVRGRLSAEAGAMLMRALESARETLYQQRRAAYDPATARDETPSFPQQQADALVLVAESALAHGVKPGAHRRDRREDESGSAGLAAGTPASRSLVSLPGLSRPGRAGASHPTLGGRRAHDPVESVVTVSPSPSRRARRGVGGGM
jgi:hypothetical protein